MFSRQEEVYGIQDVQCNGTEYMLSDCQNSTAISDECLNGNHVAGVRCVNSKNTVITYNTSLVANIENVGVAWGRG